MLQPSKSLTVSKNLEISEQVCADFKCWANAISNRCTDNEIFQNHEFLTFQITELCMLQYWEDIEFVFTGVFFKLLHSLKLSLNRILVV